MAAGYSPLHSIIKTQFGLGEGDDDFDSEPTSVLDLTQCISPPPLQPDPWVEQQQQAAIWELNLWQQQQQHQQLQHLHQQNLLWEHQLREEQQLWEEQQLQSMWEQNESDMQYLYANDQIMDDASCEFLNPEPIYPVVYGGKLPLLPLAFPNSVELPPMQLPSNTTSNNSTSTSNNSSSSSLPSVDDYEAQSMLDSWISNSGIPDSFPSPSNAQTDSSPTLLLDESPMPELDCKFQSEDYGLAGGSVEDKQELILDQLFHKDELILPQYRRENLELGSNSRDYSLQSIVNNNNNTNNNNNNNNTDRFDPLPAENLLMKYDCYPRIVSVDIPPGDNSENSVNILSEPIRHPPSSRNRFGNSDNYSETGSRSCSSSSAPAATKTTTAPAPPVARVNSAKSRDGEEDCLSITSVTRPPVSTPTTQRNNNNNTTISRNSGGGSGGGGGGVAVPGSGRMVTLAELASGGVKMGGVQLSNVGSQIPSVIKLQVETQATAGMGGVRMVQLLLACAEAVACRDSRQANILLQQLQHMATPYGDAMQRITACFVEGLTARLAITGSQPFKFSSKPQGLGKPPSEREKLEGFQLVYRVSPFLAFGHLAANSAILEAFEKEDRLHIVDLGMSHALQWPSLLHDLAARARGPPISLRITGFGLNTAQLKEAGEELIQIAKARNIPFEFRAVTESLENMKRSMLELREGEALAVNSVLQLHCVVKESRGSLNAVLQTIHELSPKILTLVEQDASHNGPFFLGRFMEALHYYSAIFDSLDVILPRNCPHRLKMEQFHFAEEIKNIVSCEGPARVERHERVDQWRRKMSRAGFQPLPLKFLTQARMWLSHYNCDGYTLSEEKGCLVMGWKGKPIIAASSWKR